MEEAKNNTESTHERIMSKMKSRYPDRNFDSEDGQSNLEQSIIDALDAYEAETSEYNRLKEDTDILANLFNTSPRSAKFLSYLASTGDPAAAIYNAYGKDAKDAFLEGNASELISEMEAEDAKRIADDKGFAEEKEANLKRSFETLDRWGDKKGLTQEQKVEVFMNFYNILGDALNGIYNEELFEMGWKASHYDEDVDSARREGEVAGRNSKIDEIKHKRRSTETMPPALNGQGVRESESRRSAAMDDPWMLRD